MSATQVLISEFYGSNIRPVFTSGFSSAPAVSCSLSEDNLELDFKPGFHARPATAYSVYGYVGMKAGFGRRYRLPIPGHSDLMPWVEHASDSGSFGADIPIEKLISKTPTAGVVIIISDFEFRRWASLQMMMHVFEICCFLHGLRQQKPELYIDPALASEL